MPSFRDHVKHFTAGRPGDADAVSNIKTLFRDIEQSSERSRSPIRTHECMRSLGMTGYVGNSQFDAEECVTHVINLFYPGINNINHSNFNKVQENCLFPIDGGEIVLCLNCNKKSNKLHRIALCQFEFPELDVQISLQLKMESMTMDQYGHVIGEPYQCVHCYSVRTQASPN